MVGSEVAQRRADSGSESPHRRAMELLMGFKKTEQERGRVTLLHIRLEPGPDGSPEVTVERPEQR